MKGELVLFGDQEAVAGITLPERGHTDKGLQHRRVVTWTRRCVDPLSRPSPIQHIEGSIFQGAVQRTPTPMPLPAGQFNVDSNDSSDAFFLERR